MLLARFIGRTFMMIAAVLVAIAGVVLIILGATASPTDSGFVVTGVVLIVVGALFFLDALTDPTRGHRIEIGGPDN